MVRKTNKQKLDFNIAKLDKTDNMENAWSLTL